MNYDVVLRQPLCCKLSFVKTSSKKEVAIYKRTAEKVSMFQGRDDFEAECIVCGYGTFVSVANKGKLSLDMYVESKKHKKAIGGETSSAKVTDYFCKLGTQAEDNVAAAEVTMAFHTVKHH